MGFFSNLFKSRQSEPITMYPLPTIIETAINSNNPYLHKYSNNGTENTIYLLYCDFSSSYKWIQDSNKPDIYFQNYVKSIQILNVLNSYKKHKFNHPTPAQQIADLRTNYIENMNRFIDRYWISITENAKKLKTEKGKENRLNKFFDILNDYSPYLTEQNISYINSFRSKTIYDSVEIKKQDIVCGKYDVSTVENIRAIPNTDYNVMRLLQKAATTHKRNNDLDLAIECLKKSNLISDTLPERTSKLSANEYLRVINYINSSKNPELANEEKEKIRKIHPEFWDKRISNKKHIKEKINQYIGWNNDLVEVFTNPSCPICSKYNQKIFSISGKNSKYTKLPDEIKNQTHSCKDCIMTIHSFIEGISTFKPVTLEEMAEMDNKK